ncbi:MAG: nitrate- and nitrite sensing domain-containing protein [Pseudomonadota bacterium]
MIQIFTNASISVKIAILCALPILALTFAGVDRLMYERREASEAQFVADMVELAPAISGLVHELQKERGMSAGFIGSKGASFSDAIGTQRSDTDVALANFNELVGQPSGRLDIPIFVSPYEKATQALAKLENVRSSVDRFDYSVGEMAGFYTPLISELLNMVESMVKVIDDGRAKRPLLGYAALLQAKERAGIERAMGAAGFGAGEFPQQVYRNFIRLGAMQDTFFTTFRRYGMAEDVAFFEEQVSATNHGEYEEYRSLATGAPFGSDISGVTGPQWFVASTGRIDAIKQVEDQVATSIGEIAKGLANGAMGAFWFLLVSLVGLLALCAVLSYVIAQSVAVPIKRLAITMRALASNDFSVEVVGAGRTDEVGNMAKAVQVFKVNAEQRFQLEREGQIERDKERQRQGYVADLVDGFRTSMNTNVSLVGDQTTSMRNTAARLAEIAQSASSDAISAGGASEGASENVQTVAAATEELSSSIREISSQTAKAADLMTSAADTARATDTDVSALSEAAERIGQVVGLIREIAEQTNLLALNATIEAARAGDAGKGFAVVASEVKTLASQTAKATEEIASQISGIQNSTRGAVESIRRITSAVTDIRDMTTSIAGAVEQQQTATQEIAESVQAASSGTNTVSESVASVSGSIEQTADEAQTVEGASNTLSDATQTLMEEVERFLEDVSKDVEDRRHALRTKMRECVVIDVDGQRQTSTMVDGSPTGARIAGVEGLKPGTKIDIALSDGRTISAMVVRESDGEIGVQFEKAVDSVEELMAA